MLWEHQKKTIKKGLEIGSLALLQDPGVGKTLSTIKICEGLYQKYGGIQKTLIFSPANVIDNWRNEFKKFTDIDNSFIYVVKGTKEKRLKLLNQAIYENSIISINYEAIQNKQILSTLLKFQATILILDESHRCKNPNSIRSKSILKLSDNRKHKFILTGTPILNTSLDLFQQFKILDGGRTFGQNFYAFRAKYFEDKNAAWSHYPHHFPVWVPKKKMQDEFNELIEKISVKVNKKDCLDLPPLINKKASFKMSAEQKRAYEDMKHEFIAFVQSDHGESKAVVANFALHKALRMQQIACGFVKTDDGELIKFKNNPRLTALKEILTDLIDFEKIIIWAHFQPNQDDICKMLDKMKVKYATLFGRTTDKQHQINQFQEDSDTRVIVASQAAGGVGVNLQEASTAIYYSKGFSLEHDIQSVARCYRGGSEKHEKITRIDLVCPETIDEIVTDSLKLKKKISDEVLEYSSIL